MRPRTLVVIVLVVSLGVISWLYFPSFSGGIPSAGSGQVESGVDTSSTAPQVPATPSFEEDESAIKNYDECIAAGNSPLPDAPDKCLTKVGHIFIQGVVE